MNNFEKALIQYVGEDKLKKIQNVKIGIAGAGGLGSNCAVNLVRSGFKKMKIIDFDIVETKNLNRQFYFLDQVGIPKTDALKINLLRINPDMELEINQDKITIDNIERMFDDCDVIVEAFDRADYKAMIVERYFSSGKFLVSASGLAGWGSCDDIAVKEIHSKFYLIGDLSSEANENCPPMSPRVNIAAAKQADVILGYILSRM
ncbi:MAG: sulfur carrier protein ThiS adenylyltransferase ThiF [Actinobacteria bacterium]|nr:sulfur carrier protein ThiS adenylyltransferase ThiF [Actinomycetota bacterium]